MDQEDHINYSIDYLQRYLNGELTDKEMQALERDALNDPFLADAIEGLEESRKQAISFESGVADLNKRLSDRVLQQRRKKAMLFMFPRWQVAASILLLLGLTTLTITMIYHSPEQKAISSVKKRDEKKIGPVENKKDSQQVAIQPPAKTDSTSLLRTITLKKTKSPVPVLIDKEIEAVDSTVSPPRQMPAAVAAPMVLRKEKMQEDTAHFIHGFVLDETGKAVEAASVRLMGQNKDTTTDLNGYFKLYVKDKKNKQEIAINSIGFNSVHSTISTDSPAVKYHLQMASTSLNEVVVTGYGIQRESKELGYSTQKIKNNNQTPIEVNEKTFGPGEWDSLNNYINDHKKINTADSVLKGEEIVSFIVNKKGKLSSIEVIKSVSPSHDAEVVRRLKSGPKLHPADGKKDRYQIRISF